MSTSRADSSSPRRSRHRPTGTGPRPLWRAIALQGQAEEGEETTSKGRGAVDGKVGSSGRGRSAGGGGGTGRGGRAGGAAAGRRRASRGRAGGAGARVTGFGGLLDGLVAAQAVASLLTLELSSGVSAGGGDTVAVPDKAHLAGDSLLVLAHGARDIGTVAALARVLEGGLRVC